jgi:hypothetical protein
MIYISLILPVNNCCIMAAFICMYLSREDSVSDMSLSISERIVAMAVCSLINDGKDNITFLIID